MAQRKPNEKTTMDQVLKLADQLTPGEQEQLVGELKAQWLRRAPDKCEKNSAGGRVVSLDAVNRHLDGVIFEDLECLFTIKQKSKVQEFLLKNRFLFLIVLEAFSKIDELFHLKLKCELSLVENHEENASVLLLAIPVCETDSEVTNTLEEFHRRWWLANLEGSKSLMTVDLRFVPA